MIMQVQISHFENPHPEVYKASETSRHRMNALAHLTLVSLSNLSSIVITHWHSLSLSFIHSCSKYVPDIISTIVLEGSEVLSTSLPLLLLLAFLKWHPLSPAFPVWLTCNSSKFYVKGQLLCESSPSSMRVSTVPCTVLHHCTCFICISVVSLQVLPLLDCDFLRA